MIGRGRQLPCVQPQNRPVRYRPILCRSATRPSAVIPNSKARSRKPPSIRVLRDLAAEFPDLASRLKAMAEATVDLLPVTRENWYHRDQRGSWSIKAVLPTIASELDCGALEVKDGGDAQGAWLEAANPACDPLRRNALEKALKVYCARDTWAMVAVARALIGSNLKP
ncbi:DUF2779 domain-containing protein [Erythrobacter litoralis]|uniref:DUF2779 domain-containing protein n=2 Tax=Erythrobacter litoralis TaxID=39960 RepID=UPI00215050C3|nr:DUF2779 domain-containing protein [Erythrobacter litoralis]